MNEPETIVPDYGPPAVTSQPTEAPVDNALSAEELARVLTGANWFFWIAGLSVINSIIAHSGSQWSFIVGLGITQVADAIFAGSGGVSTVVAILFDATALTIFVVLGYLSRLLKLWAFAIGMVLYALDGLLFLLVGDYLSIAFHAYALFGMFLGFNVLRKRGS